MARNPALPLAPVLVAVRALLDGSQHRVRLSRLIGTSGPVYEGPAILYVQRAGERVVVVTTADREWAEFSEQDAYFPASIKGNGPLSFVAEDYLMEILS